MWPSDLSLPTPTLSFQYSNIVYQVPPFGKYLKNTDQVPTTILGTGNTAVNRTKRSPYLSGAYLYVEKADNE